LTIAAKIHWDCAVGYFVEEVFWRKSGSTPLSCKIIQRRWIIDIEIVFVKNVENARWRKRPPDPHSYLKALCRVLAESLKQHRLLQYLNV
jgi:hypothetical protein